MQPLRVGMLINIYDRAAKCGGELDAATPSVIRLSNLYKKYGYATGHQHKNTLIAGFRGGNMPMHAHVASSRVRRFL